MTLADDTEITHSHIIEENNPKKVEVHFECPTEDSFDTARCILPDYTWIKVKGYNDEEIENFNELLRHNVHLFLLGKINSNMI